MRDREYKGRSLIDFPSDYTVIDVDATGYHYGLDELVGVSALRIRNGQPAGEYHSLIRPTDIETAMAATEYSEAELAAAPQYTEVLTEFMEFISSDILVGHNVSFDINFIYDYLSPLGIRLGNDFIDTLRISRKLFKDLDHHRLTDMMGHFGMAEISGLPKSARNCQYTYELLNKLHGVAIEQYGDVEAFQATFKKKKRTSYTKASDFQPADFVANEENPFYKKYVTFTGTLEKMQRKEAMQIVATLGGICKDSVIEKTNYLVLGNNDYNPILKGKKSSKLIKAEKMRADGKDIEILSESLFYDLLEECL